jgi:phospholipase C
VVLMMENHSYDNYLGMLPGRGEGFPLGPDGQPEVSNTGTDGEVIRAFPQPDDPSAPRVPSQSWQASHLQWGEGKCDGFVTSAQTVQSEARAGTRRRPTPRREATATAMGYWTESDLPFYYGLARTFPVADRWFSSCLGPTFPNRRFLIAGTAHGLIDDSSSTAVRSRGRTRFCRLQARSGGAGGGQAREVGGHGPIVVENTDLPSERR